MYWKEFLAIAMLAMAYMMIPPRPFPDRIARIDEQMSSIDNTLYEQEDDWWQTGTGLAAGLHSMNPGRVGFYIRTLKQAGAVKVADIGCGGGILTEELAQAGFTMIGVDQSQNLVNQAQKHAQSSSLEITYKKGTAYDLPLPSGAFDAVVMSDVLEHLHDLPTALSEIARVLKPGGIFVFDTINRTWRAYIETILLAQFPILGIMPTHTHDHRLYIIPDELCEGLRRVGMACAPREYMRGISYTAHLPGLLERFALWDAVHAAESNDTTITYLHYAVKPSVTL